MHDAEGADRLLKISEAAAAGYGAPSTLRRYIREGRLPGAVKSGRDWRIPRADLEALLTPRVPTYRSVQEAVARIVATAPPLAEPQIQALSSALGDGLRDRQQRLRSA
ncbi:helix-turn-helix domain-containing protein [Gordonia paraffinivorans]|uniref:helix-turn-helix domain-containing protein n=1 Tax=Gordonia paraffinivorans TaxID=175628 RepID=UPI001E54A798|nr:helix-turn-helix domain-containing protein [Gordonia paraffinivorans]MCD2143728.1 helix-turn-helix domain-containing protein [Gordonia paraffinivorans]